MSEFPPPGVTPDAAERAAQALTPDAVSAILADFRDWLMALQAPASEDEAAPGTETIDLHTLLGQFVAVRQEVNLQTRAVRAQQEQNTETLRQLSGALENLRQAQARSEQMRQPDLDEAIRPFLKTLVDLHDALSLASREIQKVRDTIQTNLEQLATSLVSEPEPEPSAVAPASFWARLWGFSRPQGAVRVERSSAQQEREQVARESSQRVQQLLGSLMMGYSMSVQRVERTLRQHGLEAIPTTGQRFDPERMEVVEAVADSGRASGEVLDEVRRGYLWNGRVFRYAQVRVAKG